MQERKLDLGQSKNNLYQLTADGNVMSSRVCVHVAIVTCFCCVKTTRESLNAEDVEELVMSVPFRKQQGVLLRLKCYERQRVLCQLVPTACQTAP
jgi:hypothetical protein